MMTLLDHLKRITPIHAMPPDGVSVEDFNDSLFALEDAIKKGEVTGAAYLNWTYQNVGYTMPVPEGPLVAPLQAFLTKHSVPLFDPYAR